MGDEEQTEPEAVTADVKNEIDLDALGAARREGKHDGPTVRFHKKTFGLPVELPYDLVTMMAQVLESEGFEFSGPLEECLKLLLGDDQFAKFKKLKPAVEDIGALIEGVFVLYGLKPGEPPASSTS